MTVFDKFVAEKTIAFLICLEIKMFPSEIMWLTLPNPRTP